MKTETAAGLVDAARRGRPDAWQEIVERFQDLAVALALGWTGDLESARDASQEAFWLAYRHLDELAEPAAFPGWFARIVRTACARQVRRPRVATVPLAGDPLAAGADPAAIAIGRRDAERVRAAVEALPEPQRAVVALHYLADLSYPEVSDFLRISLSAAKKRGHAARARLKELLPMTADPTRPANEALRRDDVLLFAAIRRRDRETVRRLLARDPALVAAREEWTAEEALAAGLPLAAHASPLVRAAGAGDLELVRMLLDAGGNPDTPCECGGAETPLWTAALVGASAVVRRLLEAGADPNAAAFAGATPLHVAAQRDRDDIARLLLDAGADPDRRDRGGRTPAEWAERAAAPGAPPPPDLLMTGIRALDLFAPLRRGCLQRWPAAHGLGQFVMLAEVSRALAPAPTWWIGFEQPLIDGAQLEHLMAESGIHGEVRLVERGLDPTEARARFERIADEALRDGGAPRLVICLEAPGHAHDVTLLLPRLRRHPRVVATLVVEAFTGEWPAPTAAVPDGYDGQVAFSRELARLRIYPAIDPATTVSRTYPTARHAALAAAARRPDAAERLAAYLAQPFSVAEPFTSRPAEWTEWRQLLAGVEEHAAV